jgi:hypothetical protein
MSNRNKLLFFDIDGTLVGFDGRIPESTYTALDMARSKGHKIFICTGRSYCQIYDYLLTYGFDGIVAATGAYVEYDGKVIRHETMGVDRISKMIGYFEAEHISYTLQSAETQISSPRMLEILKRNIDSQLKDLKREDDPNVFASVKLVDDLAKSPEKYAFAEKAMYYDSPKNIKEITEALAPYFDVTASSFEKPDDTSGEITMAGINKASGMSAIGEWLNSTREDMIAFGDGPNDIDMLEYAGTGIAMGNAGEYTKSAADMITDRIDEDGIYNTLKKLEVI